METSVTIGIGQSMGGSLTIVQQGRYHGYDGVACWATARCGRNRRRHPGTPPLPLPWVPRDTEPSDGVITNAPALAELGGAGFASDDMPAHGVGLPLRRRGRGGGAARPRGLSGPARRRPAVGVGHGADDGGAVVHVAGRDAGRGGSHPLPRPRGAGRAGRAGRPAGRGAGVRVRIERRLLRVSPDGAHAQLRRDAGAVLAAHRDVGRMGAGGARRDVGTGT